MNSPFDTDSIAKGSEVCMYVCVYILMYTYTFYYIIYPININRIKIDICFLIIRKSSYYRDIFYGWHKHEIFCVVSARVLNFFLLKVCSFIFNQFYFSNKKA